MPPAEAPRDEFVPLALRSILALVGAALVALSAVLALTVLFYVRLAELSGLPAEFEPPGSLRAGFYVGVAGGLLAILTGRSLRSR